MLITTVTVSFQETHSLPGYCNVKPGLSLTAQVDSHDDPVDVVTELTTIVQDYVRGEIDHARERARPEAIYNDEAPEQTDLWGDDVICNEADDDEEAS